MVASQEAARRAACILTAQSRVALAHDLPDQSRAALNDPPNGVKVTLSLEPLDSLARDQRTWRRYE